jgi:hypothetical protein
MLTFEVRINDGLIMTGKVVRRDRMEGTDLWYGYDYTVSERTIPHRSDEAVQERVFRGDIYHKYSDGAGELVKTVLKDINLVKLGNSTTPPLLMIP